jgi:hypothetical protein
MEKSKARRLWNPVPIVSAVPLVPSVAPGFRVTFNARVPVRFPFSVTSLCREKKNSL